jgi:hypothetical protein
MSYVCLWTPSWPTAAASDAPGAGDAPAKVTGDGAVAASAPGAELLTALLAHAPRVATAPGGTIWADARGLDPRRTAEALQQVACDRGITDMRAAAAATPLAAEIAARYGTLVLTVIKPGNERAYLAPFAVAALARADSASDVGRVPRPTPDETRLLASLETLGVETCGQLAALSAESVEVRLGAEGMWLWRLARGQASPWLFRAPMRALPQAALEWADYVLTDPERLLFVVNALAGTVCTALAAQGERARETSLHFRLASGARVAHTLRSARPSAEQRKWLRLARAALERIVLPDAVVGVELRVEKVTGNDGAQGDLFDRGFASAGAVDEATADLLDDQGEDVLVRPANSGHPLLDQRTSWTPVTSGDAARGPVGIPDPERAGPHLTLQLVTPPREITVETEPRRDHEKPVRYRDDMGWHGLVESAGPERISGGTWETPFAREYFRCVREDGVMVWMYRGGAQWYMQGWWD